MPSARRRSSRSSAKGLVFLKAIDRLDAPGDDEARIQQLLTHLEQAGTAARRARAAARRGDEDAVMVAIGEADSQAAQAQHIARDLGARTCAEP